MGIPAGRGYEGLGDGGRTADGAGTPCWHLLNRPRQQEGLARFLGNIGDTACS